MEAMHDLVRFCRRRPRWVAFMVAFILLWTLELFLVQSYTLIPPQNIAITNPRLNFWGPIIRFAGDLLFVTSVAILLHPRWLLPVSIVTFFVHLGLVTYYQYLFRPLSLLRLISNWRDGVELGKFALELFPIVTVIVLGIVLLVKCGLLFKVRERRFPRRAACFTAAGFAFVYALLFWGINQIDPLKEIQTTRGVGRLGIARGYLQPWLAELYYLSGDNVRRVAQEYADSTRDELSPHETPLPIQEHLVIIQAESLDFNILDFKAQKQEVTPFLNRLRDNAMFYRVHAAHTNGSADADFVTINGGRPSPHVINYNIPGLIYRDPLPRALGRAGFETSIFHGNYGSFYSRRQAFETMGFASLNFLEELERKHGVRTSRWGALDADVLRISTQQLREARGKRVCHFIITLTTHTPYRFLPASEELVFPFPENVTQRYLNNMRYLDDCLGRYIQSLEGSRTTVIIYGDHATEVADDGFQPDRHGRHEYVPCFIYDTTQNLAKLQKTRGAAISKNGWLHLLDVMTYLRHQVRDHFEATPSHDSASEAEKDVAGSPRRAPHPPTTSTTPELTHAPQ